MASHQEYGHLLVSYWRHVKLHSKLAISQMTNSRLVLLLPTTFFALNLNLYCLPLHLNSISFAQEMPLLLMTAWPTFSGFAVWIQTHCLIKRRKRPYLHQQRPHPWIHTPNLHFPMPPLSFLLLIALKRNEWHYKISTNGLRITFPIISIAKKLGRYMNCKPKYTAR